MTAPVMHITARQDEVLRAFLHDGASEQELGRRLGINHETVGTHFRKLYAAAREAGVPVNSRQELMAAMYHRRLRVAVRWGKPK